MIRPLSLPLLIAMVAWISAAQVTSAITFDDWQARYFTAGQLADPTISGPASCLAGDGQTNLTKYAEGANPFASSASKPLTIAINGNFNLPSSINLSPSSSIFETNWTTFPSLLERPSSSPFPPILPFWTNFSLWSVIVAVSSLLLHHHNQRQIAKATLLQRLEENALKYPDVVGDLETDFKRNKTELNHTESREPPVAKLSEEEKDAPPTPTTGTIHGESKVREYLRFLELLMALLENRVLKPSDIFPLFGRRILIAVNNSYVRRQFFERKNKAKPQRSFCSLFALHHYLLRFFESTYGKAAVNVLEDTNVTRKSDLSACEYYKSGVNNYRQHVRGQWWEGYVLLRRVQNWIAYRKVGWPIAQNPYPPTKSEFDTNSLIVPPVEKPKIIADHKAP